MSRGKYTVKIAKSIWADPDPTDEGWQHIHVNDLTSLASTVFDTPEPIQFDTGLLDKNGNPIVREMLRNPIGFRAVLLDDV